MASRRIGWWVICGPLYSKCDYIKDEIIVECCSFLIIRLVLLLDVFYYLLHLILNFFPVLRDDLVLILYYKIPLFDVFMH